MMGDGRSNRQRRRRGWALMGYLFNVVYIVLLYYSAGGALTKLGGETHCSRRVVGVQ